MRQERDRQAGAAAVVEARRRLAAGDAQGAFRALRACAVEHPAYAPAYVEAARLLLSRGDRGGATQLLSDALGRIEDEGRGEVAGALATLLADIRVTGWHPRLEADVLACLAEPEIDAQVLARTAADLLLAKYPQGAGADLDDLAKDPLGLTFLSRCLNVQPAMEVWIEEVRRRLVEQAGRDAALPESARGLGCALALQAFACEYLTPRDAAEGAVVKQLHGAGDQVGAVIIAAFSRPLSALESLDPAQISGIEAIGDGLGRLLLKRTRDDLRTEQALAEVIPGLQGLAGEADAVSRKVRQQYEANPYPRWLTPPLADGRRLSDDLARLGPFTDGSPEVRRILIAGCGTGYEAIDIARREPQAAVVAVDLSRASLAYGRRMADELGIGNLDFRHGDILDLAGLEADFDLVTCTGVLHHMADPTQGLKALRAVARPGAPIRVALYSHRARAPVRAAHEVIAREGLEPTAAGVRALRRIAFAAPAGSALNALTSSDDFHSVSGCRDLVFHVHEQAFTLPQIADLAMQAGVEVIGLDAPPPAVSAFRQAYGASADLLDLGLWDRLEQAQPFLFAAMYPLWLRAWS
ncbi:class I SAM-dependent methyltransferase [Brevundimonas sp.]|uniref:class I SAM-dependent methyltransferase n=1 Tax=Brevundimonas sp. TaxID=1871086 RepID=UPI003BAB86B7